MKCTPFVSSPLRIILLVLAVLSTSLVAKATTVATPTFSPAAGSYTGTQSVTIHDTTSGATIFYTTNGNTPNSGSTRYTGTISVSTSETIKAIAELSGDTNSAVASAAYTITVPAPAFSPAAGSYTGTQSVTISDAMSGVTIYYTTDGSTPTTNSTRYTGAISVSASETVKAIGVLSGATTSTPASAAYTITPLEGTLTVYIDAPTVQSSSVSGVTTQTFDSLPTGKQTTNFVWKVGSSTIGTYAASSTVPFDVHAPGGLYGGANNTNYFSVGGDSGSTSPTFLTLSQPASYVGFWWAAGDANNRVALYSGSTLYGTFSTADLLKILNNGSGTVTALSGSTYNTSAYFGNPNLTAPNNDSGEPFAYVSFVITGATITQIAFYNTNTSSSFESDNHSIIFSGTSFSVPTTFVPVESMSIGTQPVTVTVAPASANVSAGGTQQFTATVTGSSNTAVNWTISPTTGAGTVNTSGLYTAPATVTTPRTATITATSQANTAVSASGTVNLRVTPTLSVASSSNPSTYGNSVTFTATISSGPTGTITFYDGGVSIGTGTISGTTATLMTTSLAAGSHSITAGWAGNTNYNPVTSSAITQTVNRKALTVSGVTANNKTYDGTTAATLNTSGVAMVGVVSGDTVTLGTGGAAGTFAQSAVGSNITVTVSGLTLSGASASNYTLTQPTTTASITAKTLTVTGISANNKTYDGTTAATLNIGGASLVGVVSGDTVTLNTSSAASTFAQSAVGSNITVTVTGLSLSGASASNYTLTQPTTTASITAKALTVSGITANNKTYDGTTAATLNTSGASLVGVVSGDTVTLNTSSVAGTFAQSSPGTNITVTVTGLLLSGASAGNYTLTQPTTTASITSASSFTLSASAQSLNIAQGNSGTSTITVTGANGFSGSVNLAASGLPSGVTATFATNPTTGTSVMTLAASNSATLGPITVTITGTSGSLTASTTISLVVTAPCASNGYSYVRAIDIDHTKVPNTDQINFPFLFSMTDPLLATTANNGHVVNPNGYDIIFTSDPGGQNPLPYELEEYNPATGQAVAWVQIPDLSHTSDTVIYLFYGNPNITTSQQNPTAVWDSNYKGVWHLPNGNNLSANDSTANGNNGKVVGATATTGKIDGGLNNPNSTSGYIDLSSTPLAAATPSAFTLEAWVNISGMGSYPAVIDFDANNSSNWGIYGESGNGIGLVVANTMQTMIPLGSFSVGWNHIVATNNSNGPTMYLNGTPAGGSWSDSSYDNGVTSASIGLGYSGRLFNGLIDEVRVSNIVRSADWIATEYANENSPFTFYTLTPENAIEAVPAAVSLLASQSQQFAVPGVCSDGVPWSMPSGGPGTLTTSGLYTAPASITQPQTVTISGLTQTNNTTTSTVTLVPQVWPVGGPAGTVVTIYGQGFGSAEGSNSVTVGGLPAVTLFWNNSQIQVQIPTGTGLGNQQIVITVNNQVIAQTTFNVAAGIVGVTPPATGLLAATTINTASQAASLIFYGTKGQIVSFQQAGNTFSNQCTEFAILNPDGSQLYGKYMCAGQVSDPNVLPSTGTYSLVINSQGSTAGSTSFTLWQFSNLTGNLTPGVTFPLSINFPDQAAYLSFSGTAGQIVSVQQMRSSFSDSCGWASYTVLNPDGSYLNGQGLCPGNVSSPYTLPTTGTYTLVVDPKGATGSASFVLWEFANVTGIINPGVTYPLSLSFPSQEAFLSFSGTAGQIVKVQSTISTFTDSCGWAEYTVLNPNGSYLNGQGLCSGSITGPYTLPTTGIYTLVVNPQGPTGNANLLLTETAAILISPANVTLWGGQVQQFTATVNGDTNSPVNWTLTPVTGAGTISSMGLYTAPPSISAQQTVTVTATSVAALAQPVSATITLIPHEITVAPSTAVLYGSQVQTFTATCNASCPGSMSWSVSPSGLGTLVPNGFTASFTAPANITAQQSVTITAINPNDNTYAPAVVTLMPPAVAPTLSLSAIAPPPYVTGAAQTFYAVLKNRDGTPLSGGSVTFNVTGANSNSGSVTTDSTGTAAYIYTGTHSGNDVVHASASIGSEQVTSNSVSATWATPAQPISNTTVTGRFYLSDGSGIFDTPLGTQPVFVQTFPSLIFNPPSGTIPGLTTVNNNSRPFTNVTTDANGNVTGTIVAQGNGYQAGCGPSTGGSCDPNVLGDMTQFQAVFSGEFTVANAGTITFTYLYDDSFILGIGNGAAPASDAPILNAPAFTTFDQLPTMGSVGLSFSSPPSISVNFPGPGTYPFEVDYVECCSGPLILVITASGTGSAGVPTTGSLMLSPDSVSPQPAGGSQTFTVFATDVSGNPLANANVGLVVTGDDELQLSGTTDSTGHATIVYNDVNPGTAYVQAVAFMDGMVTYSDQVTVTWTSSGGGGTGSGGGGGLTQGWIGSPANGSGVSGIVPITVAAGETLTSGTLSYYPASNPADVTVLNSAVSGSAGQQMGTLDATALPNGTYWITLQATDSTGNSQYSLSLVTVTGNYKPGRVTTTSPILSSPPRVCPSRSSAPTTASTPELSGTSATDGIWASTPTSPSTTKAM